MQRRPLIFVVISVLIIALVYSSLPKTYVAFASQFTSKSPIECKPIEYPGVVECCQTETDYPSGIEIRRCTQCDNTDPPSNCGPYYPEEVALPPPQPGPKGPLGTIPGGEIAPEVAPPTEPEEGAEGDNETQSRLIGGSPTGKCNPTVGGPFCTPCDPLSTNPECIPVSQCVPPRCIPPRTDTGAPEEEPKPLVPPTTGPLGEIAPQVAPPTTAEDGSQQPPTQPLCPEGQVLDEETGLCVLEESQAVEQPEDQPQVEEEQQPAEEEDGSEDNSNN